MDTPRQLLIDSMMRSGVSQADAEEAVDQHEGHVEAGSGAYTATGLAAYFLGMNPATAVPYLVAAPVLGAGYGFFSSPQCQNVREAVSFWKTAEF